MEILKEFVCDCNLLLVKNGKIVNHNFTIQEGGDHQIVGECKCGQKHSFRTSETVIVG
jgi:hypothetical protein